MTDTALRWPARLTPPDCSVLDQPDTVHAKPARDGQGYREPLDHRLEHRLVALGIGRLLPALQLINALVYAENRWLWCFRLVCHGHG